MAHNSEVNAIVGVRSYGSVYIGVVAREMLDLGRNNRVRVTFPRAPERPDITVTGCLTDSNHFYVGRDMVSKIVDGFGNSSSIRTEAIVEPAARSWEDTHGLTEKRYDDVETLDAYL